MASNKGSTSSAGLFGQSLDGDVLFDQISGPRLFTPIPLSSPEKTTQPPPAVNPPRTQHAQLFQNQSKPSSLPPDINTSFTNPNNPMQQRTSYNSPMVSQVPGPLRTNPSAGFQSQPYIANVNIISNQRHQQQQPLKQNTQLHHQQLRQQPQHQQQVHQQPQQPHHQQPHHQQQSALAGPYHANALPPVSQNPPINTPAIQQFIPSVPLYSPYEQSTQQQTSTTQQQISTTQQQIPSLQQQTQPTQRPTQIVSPTPKQVYPQPITDPINEQYTKLPPIPAQPELLPPIELQSDLPQEYNISPLAGKATDQKAVPLLPVQALTPHWFYFKNSTKWLPFSYFDSNNLETLFINTSSNKCISTDGGRFDVNLETMQKTAIYWSEAPCEVRRCTWFHKGGSESKLIPYDTTVAERLEREYSSMMKSGIFNIRVDISPGKFVIFHNPNVLVQYTSSLEHMDWTGEDSKIRPKVVRRGISEVQEDIERGETDEIDHLVFVVHGIGPVADLRMRSIVECVDDFRKISYNQVSSHQFTCNDKRANRVEFLPIQWYSCLRDDRYGIDKQLKALSLPSISKLRNFTNETLTDILFFTSPVYCQTICNTVVSEMNRLYKLFKSRNPLYAGSVSVVGHSLGSCIVFDILAHQIDKDDDNDADENKNVYEDVGDVIDSSSASPPLQKTLPSSSSDFHSVSSSLSDTSLPSIEKVCSKLNLLNLLDMFNEEQIDTETLMMCSEADLRDLGIPFGPRKKILGYTREQSNEKVAVDPRVQQPTPSRPTATSTRGTQTPIPLSSSSSCENIQFSYEKGHTGIGQPLVTYPKLEFEVSCLFCMGSPIGLFLTCRGVSSIGTDFKLPTCPTFMNIFHPYDPVVYRLEPLINQNIDIPPSLIPHHKGRKRFHLEIKENLTRAGAHIKHTLIDAVNRTWTSINDFAKAHRASTGEGVINDENEKMEADDASNLHCDSDESLEEAEVASREKFDFGRLNNGHRVDFVLQENPFELINEYIFALSSHTCYWLSDDTALVITKKIYSTI